jgi:hypothetical protein
LGLVIGRVATVAFAADGPALRTLDHVLVGHLSSSSALSVWTRIVGLHRIIARFVRLSRTNCTDPVDGY